MQLTPSYFATPDFSIFKHYHFNLTLYQYTTGSTLYTAVLLCCGLRRFVMLLGKQIR